MEVNGCASFTDFGSERIQYNVLYLAHTKKRIITFDDGPMDIQIRLGETELKQIARDPIEARRRSRRSFLEMGGGQSTCTKSLLDY